MPKKTKKTETNPAPSQGQIARLIHDAIDLQANMLINSLLETMEDTGIDKDQLQKIQNQARENAATVKERSVNTLLKYY